MVSTSRASTFSRRYQQWYYESIRSYQSYTPPVVVRSTCPRDGQPLLDGTVSRDRSPFPDIAVEPVDFQGLDSRFSRAFARTILTGTLHHPFRLFPFDKPRLISINSLLIQGWLMSMIMRSPGFRSLAHESLAFILSHLPSHRLQPLWGEIETALLGRLPHFLSLLPFRVIFSTDLSTLTRVHFIYSSD
jgi:hypothetical protein